MTRNQWWVLAYTAVAIIGLVRVALTYRIVSHVVDEPDHIACGYEWLTSGKYQMDVGHPPLARVLSAIPAALQHRGKIAAAPDQLSLFHEIIGEDNNYERNLAYARLGNLLFLLIATIATGLWAARYFGKAAGLLAMSTLVSLPPILGHAGVATTDLAVASTTAAAILALESWLDFPSSARAVLLGLAIGLGALSKFSFLLFFPVGCAIVAVTRCVRKRAAFSARSITVAIIVAGLVVWSGYRFQFTTVKRAYDGGENTLINVAPKSLTPAIRWFAREVPIPGPLFLIGAARVRLHDRNGHLAYLLGEVRQHGWWYYFPVIFFYKTPLAFLALALAGMVMICFGPRAGLAVALVPIGFMLSVLPSSINIGIRHILPIYPPLCICAASAGLTLWRVNRLRFVAIAALVWFFGGSLLAHPDYLAWFNEAAGRHPEQIARDSNIDWGQDTLRLARTLRREHIPSVYVLASGAGGLLWREGIEVNSIVGVAAGTPGWFALGLTKLAFDPAARAGAYSWLNSYPYTMVGKSIRLYHVPGRRSATP